MSGEDYRSKVAEKARRSRAAERKRQVRRKRLFILLTVLVIAAGGTLAWLKFSGRIGGNIKAENPNAGVPGMP